MKITIETKDGKEVTLELQYTVGGVAYVDLGDGNYVPLKELCIACKAFDEVVAEELVM